MNEEEIISSIENKLDITIRDSEECAKLIKAQKAMIIHLIEFHRQEIERMNETLTKLDEYLNELENE
jgi:hypothetical protein